MANWAYPALLVLFLAASVSAIYEDQVGDLDWKLENLGVISHTGFSSSRKVAYVASEDGVVAAVSTKSGALSWRHVLPRDEAVRGLHVDGRLVATVGELDEGAWAVRVWDGQDGMQLWEDYCRGPNVVQPHVAFVGADLDADGLAEVVLGCGSVLELRSGGDGEAAWTWEAAGPPVAVHAQGSVVHVAEHGSDKHSLRVTPLDVRTGLASASANVDTFRFDRGLVVTSDGWLVGASPLNFDAVRLGSSVSTTEGKTSTLLSLQMEARDVLGETVEDGNIRNLELVTTAVAPHAFVATFQTAARTKVTVLVEVDDHGMSLLHHATGSVVAGASVVRPTDSEEAYAFFVSDAHSSLVHLPSREVTTLSSLASEETSSKSGNNEAGVASCGSECVRGFVAPLVRKDGKVQLRVLVTSWDGVTAMLQASPDAGKLEHLWSMDGGLARVTLVEVIDLPLHVHDHHLEAKTGITRFIERVTAQYEDALISLGLRPDTLDEVPQINQLSQDAFGFRKLIIAVSSVGKVYALHTDPSVSPSERVLWSTTLRPPSGERTCRGDGTHHAVLDVAHVVVSRTASYPPPLAWFVGERSVCSAGTWKAIQLDLLTGQVVQANEYANEILMVAPAPATLSNHDTAVLAVEKHSSCDDDGAEGTCASSVRLHVLSDHRTPRSVEKVADTMHFHVLNEETNEITGYAVQPGSESGARLQTEVRWTTSLPRSERVVSRAHPKQTRVPVSARVLGNRDLLYLYLNPHLEAIATVDEASQLHIYVLDGVSGRILQHVVHEDAVLPVEMAMAENWLVYHFVEPRSLQAQFNVMEFYEDRSDPWIKNNVLGAGDPAHETFSSFGATRPYALSQSYVLPISAGRLAVTETLRGISEKQVLVVVRDEQVLGLPKKFLDPRRPVGAPTENDKEEGLVPYHPTLPVRPTLLHTFNQTIPRIRGVVSSPAKLESTSHLVVYGIDLFYIRMTPSNPFDVLGDINKPILAATICGLAVASVVLSRMFNRKQLNKMWM